MRPATVPHTRTTYAQGAFIIGCDNQRVTCPNGVTSTQWHQRVPGPECRPFGSGSPGPTAGPALRCGSASTHPEPSAGRSTCVPARSTKSASTPASSSRATGGRPGTRSALVSREQPPKRSGPATYAAPVTEPCRRQAPSTNAPERRSASSTSTPGPPTLPTPDRAPASWQRFANSILLPGRRPFLCAALRTEAVAIPDHRLPKQHPSTRSTCDHEHRPSRHPVRRCLRAVQSLRGRGRPLG